MKLSEMKSADTVIEDQLQDPVFREEWERTTLARAVAGRVIAYRAEHARGIDTRIVIATQWRRSSIKDAVW